MQYISTNDRGPEVTLRQAVLQSTPAQGGLYMPRELPVLPAPFFMNMAEMDFPEIAYVVANQLFGGDVSAAALKNIVDGAFNFPVPVTRLDDGLYVLEQFHGPTLAFKDFGARFAARMLSHLHSQGSPAARRKLHVLIATNGNTGSAMANALAGMANIEAHILFPRGHAGRQLEAQFTTLGGNIHAYEVQGTIDDCHSLVHQAFADNVLNSIVSLTSANSVNIARLLPQTFCYFYAVARLQRRLGDKVRVNLAIPAGNLGNLTAAVAARHMGLPINRIMACENANQYLTTLLHDGRDTVPRAFPTLACGADKGRPTNIDRLLYLCGNSLDALRHEIEAHSVDDAHIIRAVNGCYERYGYTIDPHTSLAYSVATDDNRITRFDNDRQATLIVATGHPAKSLTAMNAITGRPIDLPLQLTRFMAGSDLRRKIQPSYIALRDSILQFD